MNQIIKKITYFWIYVWLQENVEYFVKNNSQIEVVIKKAYMDFADCFNDTFKEVIEDLMKRNEK